MFTDKIELKDFEKQDPEYQDLLRRVLAIQADCEIGGPNLYVKDILPNAPTKLDQLIVARTAAEEMDHFRKMARLAGDIGVDVSYTLSRPNQERYVEAFRGQIKTWEDFAVFGFLVDRVGRFQLEEFIDCTYLPLARVVEDPDIIREEEGHVDFGTNASAEFAAKGGEHKERIQKAVDLLVRQRPGYVRQQQVLSIGKIHALGLETPPQRGGAPAIQGRNRRADFENGSHAPRSK